MENLNGTMNIREIMLEELRRRGINVEELIRNNPAAEKMINRSVHSMEAAMWGEIGYLAQALKEAEKNPAGGTGVQKPSRKLRDEDKSKILDQLLMGKTPEEIHELEEFISFPIEKIKMIENENQVKLLAVQLVPIDEISKITGERTERVMAYLRSYTAEGKKLLKIIKEKDAEVERRLLAGESVEDILSDRRLFISPRGIEAVKNRINKDKIKTLLIQGESIDKLREMPEFANVSSDFWRQVEDENLYIILAMQLVPVQEIAARLEVSIRTIYVRLKIDGINIQEVRSKKTAAIRQSLLDGESIEELARKLNVSEGVVKTEYRKIMGDKAKGSSKALPKQAQPAQTLRQPQQGITLQEYKAQQTEKEKAAGKRLQTMIMTFKKQENASRKTKEKSSKELSEEEQEEVSSSINEMLQTLNAYDETMKSSSRLIWAICNNAEKVYSKNLSVTQAEQLVKIIDDPKVSQAIKLLRQAPVIA